MKKHGLKDQTMSETNLKAVQNFSIHPGDSITTTDNGFINIDDGSMGGLHWICFFL